VEIIEQSQPGVQFSRPRNSSSNSASWKHPESWISVFYSGRKMKICASRFHTKEIELHIISVMQVSKHT